MCAADYIPFMMTDEKIDNWIGGKVIMKRVIEALLIAAVTGGIVLYGTQQQIKENIQSVKAQLTLQISEVKIDIDDVKKNQREFRRDLYVPRR